MTRLAKATIVLLLAFTTVAVSVSASAQRHQGRGGGGGHAYHGGGGGHAYHGGGYRGGYYGGNHYHGTRVSVGFAFGGPWWYGAGYYPYYYPSYYYPSYYYPAYGGYGYPYPAAASIPGQVYVERDRDVAAADSPYWYYCRDSDAYYPYVKQCPGSWERVPAQPAR